MLSATCASIQSHRHLVHALNTNRLRLLSLRRLKSHGAKTSRIASVECSELESAISGQIIDSNREKRFSSGQSASREIAMKKPLGIWNLKLTRSSVKCSKTSNKTPTLKPTTGCRNGIRPTELTR